MMGDKPEGAGNPVSESWSVGRRGLVVMSTVSKQGGSKEKDSTVKPAAGAKDVFLKDGSKVVPQPPKPKHRQRSSNVNPEKDLEQDPQYGELVAKLKQDGLQIGEKLGSGSYSVVLMAYGTSSTMGKPKPIAVKIICTKTKNDYVKKFLPREMKIVAQLQHPNILRFYSVKDYGEEGDLPFVVFKTEWAEGGDLLKKIKKFHAQGIKGLTEPDMKVTFRQLTDSLLWLDQRNICHRDLKAENIMLDGNENVKLGDFGFARVLRPDEKSDTFCGSRAYVAPEIILSESYRGMPADVWSVGIIIYVSTTGHFPFDETNHDKMIANQLGHKVKFPSKWKGSKQQKALIIATLEPVPDRRPTYPQILAMEFLKSTPHYMKTSPTDFRTMSNFTHVARNKQPFMRPIYAPGPKYRKRGYRDMRPSDIKVIRDCSDRNYLPRNREDRSYKPRDEADRNHRQRDEEEEEESPRKGKTKRRVQRTGLFAHAKHSFLVVNHTIPSPVRRNIADNVAAITAPDSSVEYVRPSHSQLFRQHRDGRYVQRARSQMNVSYRDAAQSQPRISYHELGDIYQQGYRRLHADTEKNDTRRVNSNRHPEIGYESQRVNRHHEKQHHYGTHHYRDSDAPEQNRRQVDYVPGRFQSNREYRQPHHRERNFEHYRDRQSRKDEWQGEPQPKEKRPNHPGLFSTLERQQAAAASSSQDPATWFPNGFPTNPPTQQQRDAPVESSTLTDSSFWKSVRGTSGAHSGNAEPRPKQKKQPDQQKTKHSQITSGLMAARLVGEDGSPRPGESDDKAYPDVLIRNRILVSMPRLTLKDDDENRYGATACDLLAESIEAAKNSNAKGAPVRPLKDFLDRTSVLQFNANTQEQRRDVFPNENLFPEDSQQFTPHTSEREKQFNQTMARECNLDESYMSQPVSPFASQNPDHSNPNTSWFDLNNWGDRLATPGGAGLLPHSPGDEAFMRQMAAVSNPPPSKDNVFHIPGIF